MSKTLLCDVQTDAINDIVIGVCAFIVFFGDFVDVLYGRAIIVTIVRFDLFIVGRSILMKVDLNSDLGESFGAYTIGRDANILELVTSCNIACGFHAGDPAVMNTTVQQAVENGVAIGAHPGLNDLEGFGRRAMQITPKEAYEMVVYQVGALDAFVKVHGGKLQHVKPHGALYNMSYDDYDLAKAIAQAIYDINPELIFMGLAGSEHIRAGKDIGLPVASEVFADRAYDARGRLVSRSKPHAVIQEPQTAVKQVLQMVQDGTVTAEDGSVIAIQADSICVHGDTDQALNLVREISRALTAAGIQQEALI